MNKILRFLLRSVASADKEPGSSCLLFFDSGHQSHIPEREDPAEQIR